MPNRRNIFARISRLSYANLSLLLMRAFKACGLELADTDTDKFIKALEQYADSLHKDLTQEERQYFMNKKLEAVKRKRKPKTPSKTLRLIKKGLTQEILKLRKEQNATWDEIAKYLSKYHRVKVSRETIRQLYQKLVTDEETNEFEDNA